MVSGGCVDTEQCKSPCLRCGLNRLMCGLGEFFEVVGTLPVQTSETDGAQPLHCRFSHVAGLSVCSLQQSLYRNTHLICAIVLSSPSSLLFFGVCGFLIFWEHPVCVFNAVGHSLFSLRPLTITALLLLWEDKKDRRAAAEEEKIKYKKKKKRRGGWGKWSNWRTQKKEWKCRKKDEGMEREGNG